MVWVLILWAAPGGRDDPRERLAAAVREARPAETRAALAALLAGDHARAARALIAALPRARDRIAALGTASFQARMEYGRIDADFTFNPFEDRTRERELAEAREQVREAERRAVDAERMYDTLREAMGSLGPDGTEVLAAEAARTPSWLLRCELLEGLGAAGAREALLRFLDRRMPPAVLAAALAGAGHERAAEFLDHPQWQVRLAALRGLRGVRAAAGAIIARMADPDARFRHEAAAVLRETTGTDLPADPEGWEGWWRANGADFAAGRYDPRRHRAPAGPGRKLSFFEVPVASSRVCFVIDRSDSMRKEGRFARARAELKRLLGEMPDGSRVNLLFFGESTSWFSRDLRVLDDAVRREAGDFIDRQRHDGGTDLHRALEKALLLVGSPESGRLEREGPDTIVVLSDGRATLGRLVDEELLGRAIARRARYLRPVFHTIGLCPGARSLELLAALTGGEHRLHTGPQPGRPPPEGFR